MGNEIIWEKWRDPFLGYDENDLDPDHKSDQAIISAISNGFVSSDDEEDEDKDNNTINSHGIKVIATPMGIIPYNEYTASGKIFNFWIGHTNFKITETILRVMENVLGVETLDIFTPYRFRVSIGKAFDATLVKQNIAEAIYEYLNKQ